METREPQRGKARFPNRSGLITVLLLAVALIAVAAGIFLIKPVGERASDVAPHQEVAVPRATPYVHCLFSDYLHERVVVGFDFAVTFSKGSPPHFLERAMAEGSDPETDFEAANRPDWRYAMDDGTPTITSPDGAIRIMLYGLKLGASDVVWTEAGLRSNDYRNLDGKCLQAHLDASP